MKKSVKFIFLLLTTTFSFFSCDTDDETENTSNCDSINLLEIVSTLSDSQENDSTKAYTFTINDTSLSNLSFEWYINGELQENDNENSSLFKFDFSKNGDYEVCLKPATTNNLNCDFKKVCTTLTFDSFTETKDNCNLLSLDHFSPNSPNPIVVEKTEGLSFDGVTAPFILNGDSVKQFKIFIDEKDATFENVIDEDPATIFNQRTIRIPFTKVGIFNVKIVAIGTSCPDEQTFYAKVVVNPNFQARITLLGKTPNTNQITENNDTQQMNCEDIEFEVASPLNNSTRALFRATKINDATYTWTVNDQVLSDNDRIALLDGSTGLIPSTSNFRLGSGTHNVAVTVISPTVCPNGTTIETTVTIQ